jgi:hypothetical protein
MWAAKALRDEVRTSPEMPTSKLENAPQYFERL